MEFNLIRRTEMEFKIRASNRNPKERRVESITRTRHSSFHLTLNPVVDESGSTIGYGEKAMQLFREISTKLLFGDTNLANRLMSGAGVPLAAHLTLTSSNTGSLKIETKSTGRLQRAGVFDALYKLQESLPRNPIEFVLSLENFGMKNGRPWLADEGTLDFKAKDVKLMQNRRGSFSLEMEDLHFPYSGWWEEWSKGYGSFTGRFQLNLKLDLAVVAELYKRFERGPSGIEVGTAADLVILVGGNENQKQGIKCHKSILSGVSPVFEAMFQADMMEKKEGVLRIMEFSEACVRALVEFGYRRNVEEALKSSEIALEMLQAAHMYEMKELMDMVLQIILSMPFAWFSADAAIKLFFFSRNVGEDLADAEKKGGMALKWYVKMFPEKLKESQEYVGLCENPAVMIDLGIEALKNVPSKCVIN